MTLYVCPRCGYETKAPYHCSNVMYETGGWFRPRRLACSVCRAEQPLPVHHGRPMVRAPEPIHSPAQARPANPLEGRRPGERGKKL